MLAELIKKTHIHCLFICQDLVVHVGVVITDDALNYHSYYNETSKKNRKSFSLNRSLNKSSCVDIGNHVEYTVFHKMGNNTSLKKNLVLVRIAP